MNRKLYLVLASAAIVISMVACSFGNILPTAAPTEAPVVIQNDPVASGSVDILSTSMTTDSYGYTYLFGEVMNNTDQVITGIELEIAVTDGSGNSLITDYNGNTVPSTTFSPLLYTLAPGDSSPFSYYLGEPASPPANHEVTVLGYDTTTQERADVDYQNVNIVEDGYGNYYLTGELVNLSNQWVHISGLAGGVLDDANNVLSADWTTTFIAELAPTGDAELRDITPFAVDFPIPTQEATQWSIWWDVAVSSNVIDYPLTVTVTNSYFDDYGDVHLVGYVENGYDSALTTILVGGLYDVDGVTLDAGYTFLGAPMAAGGTMPFDISYFGGVNYIEEQAALIDAYLVNYDPWSTYEPFYEIVDLTYSGETVSKSGASWTVSGTFTNSSDQNLTDVVVMVAVFDSSDNLVGYNYAYFYPDSDTFAPGATGAYDVYLYLDASADLSGYTTSTLVIGEIDQ